MKQKRAFTLMEIMIVIFLIGIIGGAISYNMRGSLDRGRAFKTEQAMNQLRDIFELELANGNYNAQEIAERADLRENIIKASGLSRDAKKLLKDGWNEPLEFSPDHRSPDRILISSKKLKTYNDKQKKLLGKQEEALAENAEEQ